MQVCPVCQKENPPGVEYCEDCGASLAPPSGGAAANADPAAVAPAGARSEGAAAAAEGAPTPPVGIAPEAGTAGVRGSIAAAAQAEVGMASAPASSAAGLSPDQAAAASGPPARLVVKRHGALTTEEVPLHGDRLVVGRFDPETGPVDVDLSGFPEAQHISRNHAVLVREGAGWSVRDLGSTNGVFVRGADDANFGPRLTAPRTLADGDEVAFGNARFVFRAGGG